MESTSAKCSKTKFKNATIRGILQLSDITDFIIKRQLNWIENLASKHIIKEENNLNNTFGVCKLLFAWIDKSRPVGRPIRTLRNAYVDALQAENMYKNNPDPNDFITL